MDQSIFLMVFGFLAVISSVTANTSKFGLCEAAREKALKSAVQGPSAWIPQCDNQGAFLSLQHNRSGTPFCVEPHGQKIYQPKAVSPSTPLHCDCPNRFYEALTTKRALGTFVPSCERDGTYSTVQCRPGTLAKRTGTCFCVDVLTGVNIGEKPRGVDDSYCLRMRGSTRF
ncbi:hypothetical protein RvY_01001 [Ramazzottius varieornatus]|uniref:Thyroglobulin type-1 domain-containing protein n=1 Tax=Ramazzottius varieornatus TaxID=947166 RepID=A0A1D1UPH9_RAMVA|nr:hypothetical protein RvY_01001 [Ramazzottius varieornatus]